jgi:hypothetical protein
MAACSQTSVPVLQMENEKCKGKYTSTDCIIYESVIVALGLPKNSTMTQVVNALVLAIQNNNNKITVLQQENALQATEIALLQAQVSTCCGV